MEAAAEVASRQIVYENSYITSPEGYGSEHVFKRSRVQVVIREALKERVHGKKYDPVKGAQIVKQLADEVQERCCVADLLPRHKLVVHATLVQNMGQALRAESRGLWDVATDGWASEVYENDSLVCVCQVYGFYVE